MGQGKERGRGLGHQELGHCRPPEAPSRETPLLDAGGGRHQGRREGLEGQTRSAGQKGNRRVSKDGEDDPIVKAMAMTMAMEPE